MKKFLIAASIAALGAANGHAVAGGDPDGAGRSAPERTAQCEITSGTQVKFKGECLFMPGPDGSFSLSKSKYAPLYPGIEVISVSVVDKGVAEVRGLTKHGINSRWGEARRSTEDDSCWVGSDFKVCAR